MLFIKVFTQQLFISGKKMAIKAQKTANHLGLPFIGLSLSSG